MSINIGISHGTRFAEVHDIQVNGLPGFGCYFLAITLKFSVAKIESVAHIKNFRIRLETSGDLTGKIGWGEYLDQSEITLYDHSDRFDVTFLVQLSHVQINALEKYRAGGNLPIRIWFFCEVSQGDKKCLIRECDDFVISQQEWTEALARMHYENTLLFEVRFPVAKIDDKKSLEALLTTAWRHFSKGHYSECVSYCRQVIEKIEKTKKDKSQANRAIEKYKNNRQEMSLPERILFLREAIKNATQLGVHYDENTEIGYREAKTILGATVSIVADFSMDSL